MYITHVLSCCRFSKIESKCATDTPDTAPYGVDSVFKLGSVNFNADLYDPSSKWCQALPGDKRAWHHLKGCWHIHCPSKESCRALHRTGCCGHSVAQSLGLQSWLE